MHLLRNRYGPKMVKPEKRLGADLVQRRAGADMKQEPEGLGPEGGKHLGGVFCSRSHRTELSG